MKRGDFIKEMGNSLFQTVKSVYEPFLKEDLEKVEVVTDLALGITWLPLMTKSETSQNVEMKFVNGKPIIVSMNESNMQAMSGICPVCSNIIIVTALYSSGKCLNCEKEYNFKTNEGELQLESFPIKTKDQMYFVGFQKKRNR
ncbi:MAG: hypothetical protein Q8934_02925 [Bacillota bacterium]|nr:hypothetical protein [Bacillota bacterium]